MGIDVKTVARVIVNHDVCASVSWTHAPHERLARRGGANRCGRNSKVDRLWLTNLYRAVPGPLPKYTW